jgi:hypothetical protein
MARLFVLSQPGDMTGSADRSVERLCQRFGADLRAVAAGALSQRAAAVVIIRPAWAGGSDAE